MKFVLLLSYAVVALSSRRLYVKPPALSVRADKFWWIYKNSDCEKIDLNPQPSCSGTAKGNVDKMKACCTATTGCNAFNTDNFYKSEACHAGAGGHIAADTCDLYVLEDHPQPPPPPPPPANLPWPAPNTFTKGNTTINVASSFKFSRTSAIASPILTAAFARYQALTFPHAAVASDADADALSGLVVSVSNLDESHPQVETDESYTLTVGATMATLKAATVYGAMRGLESFSQMVRFNFDTMAYEVANGPWAIHDTPRFPHRGLMIDSARHFETLAALRGIIDSLVYAKLNVLHWHMSDSQSFPLQVKSHPLLWKGAWSNEEKYTQLDVASIVEYARLRGVRVMVEFDMPGHAGSWCAGYPEVCPSVGCPQPLNVASNATFELITDLLMEMTGGKTSTSGHPSGLFPSNMIHLGGDEVNTRCWTSTPSVNAWLQAHHMTADQGYAYFVKQTAAIASSQGKRPVQWSEVFDHFKTELPKETIVHIWKSVTNVTQVLADGYQVILNVGYNAKSWYLDNLNVKWDAVYSNEPCDGVPDDLCGLILGGHGEMWGESVDMSDLEQTVWPRMAAIAERLWSPRTYNDPVAALPRIEEFRCLLNRRGVRAAPVNNKNARSSPPGPGSCLKQR